MTWTQMYPVFWYRWRRSTFKSILNSSLVQSCLLHFRGNIESKLCSLRIPNVVINKFVQDILGNPAALELGLVDAESIDELDVMIDSLESIWNQHEKPFNNPQHFPPGLLRMNEMWWLTTWFSHSGKKLALVHHHNHTTWMKLNSKTTFSTTGEAQEARSTFLHWSNEKASPGATKRSRMCCSQTRGIQAGCRFWTPLSHSSEVV